jgi:hypothetical protein
MKYRENRFRCQRKLNFKIWHFDLILLSLGAMLLNSKEEVLIIKNWVPPSLVSIHFFLPKLFPNQNQHHIINFACPFQEWYDGFQRFCFH